MRIGGDNSKLKIRTKKEREMDKRIVAAQTKLIEFAQSINQAMPIEYLLQ